MEGSIVAVCMSGSHRFSKSPRLSIRLIEGIGVEGDAHSGPLVQHLSRLAQEPLPRNLRQVHLLHAELHDEVREAGFEVSPGDIGENITTRGIDLLKLPAGTLLHLGEAAIVEVTGLRNPCAQIDRFQKGLMAAMLDRDPDGNLVRKAGIMSVVVAGGEVMAGDPIRVELPAGDHRALQCV